MEEGKGEPGGRTKRFHGLLWSITQGVVADMWRKERHTLPLDFPLADTHEEDLLILERRREAWEEVLEVVACLEREGGRRERIIAEALRDLLLLGVAIEGPRELYDLVYARCLKKYPGEGWTREGMRRYFAVIRERLRRKRSGKEGEGCSGGSLSS